MKVDEVFKILDALRLPSDDLTVCGSASLLVRGLKREPQDLDIVARGAAWEGALQFGEPFPAPFDGVLSIDFHCRGASVEVLSGWFPVRLGWSVDHLIDSAELINGYRFMPLEQTLSWKKHIKREKDLEDIEMIEEHLSRERDRRRPDRSTHQP